MTTNEGLPGSGPYKEAEQQIYDEAATVDFWLDAWNDYDHFKAAIAEYFALFERHRIHEPQDMHIAAESVIQDEIIVRACELQDAAADREDA